MTVAWILSQEDVNMTTASDLKHHVGQGWWPLLAQLDAELTEIFPDYNVVQVKEKFGDLRVYLDHYLSDEEYASDTKLVWDTIFKYEKLSSETCELCGQPGHHTDTSWVKTLCGNCGKNSIIQEPYSK